VSWHIESPVERARLLALYHPDDRAAIEAYMVEHNVTALEAINKVVSWGGTMWQRALEGR
jgi:hypothetical protein